jgi:hypothetical protein
VTQEHRSDTDHPCIRRSAWTPIDADQDAGNPDLGSLRVYWAARDKNRSIGQLVQEIGMSVTMRMIGGCPAGEQVRVMAAG